MLIMKIKLQFQLKYSLNVKIFAFSAGLSLLLSAMTTSAQLPPEARKGLLHAQWITFPEGYPA
jgi:hypothetical protein